MAYMQKHEAFYWSSINFQGSKGTMNRERNGKEQERALSAVEAGNVSSATGEINIVTHHQGKTNRCCSWNQAYARSTAIM